MRTILLILCVYLIACNHKQVAQKSVIVDSLATNIMGTGTELEIEMIKGKYHNHPLMAIWITDTDSNYIQTLYVARSIAKGVYEHGDASKGKWMPGEIRRPATLPYWAHNRNVKEADGLFIPTSKNPIPDAYTGATPQNSFILNTRLDKNIGNRFILFFEINQTWDWNDYWTNNKYPDNVEYKTSCQPAVVYAVPIDLLSNQKEYVMKAIAHSHYAGSDGSLTTDLSTLTTALKIAEKIIVRIK